MADKDEIQVKEQEIEPAKVNWFNNLVKIKGIGRETAKDIGKVYLSEQDLINALVQDRCPLRNDQVIKLKKHFQLNKS